MSGPRVQVEGVVKRFGEVTALAGVDLALAENEFVSLVGVSGCGKSTLLSIIAGLQDPDEGTVVAGGRPVTGPGRDRGVVFQQATLLPWLTARKNVEFARAAEPLTRAERTAVALEHLALVGLTGFEDAYPAQLSGGMQQRVSIARAFAIEPEILLMDEPFSALDEFTREKLHEDLLQIWRETKKTVVFVTHNIAESVFLSDRVYVLSPHPGRLSAVIDIDLPRPRQAAMRNEARFNDLVVKIRNSFEGV